MGARLPRTNHLIVSDMKSKLRRHKARKSAVRKSSSESVEAHNEMDCEDEKCDVCDDGTCDDCNWEMPRSVALAMAGLVFLPFIETVYYALIFSPRYFGGFWEAWKPRWPSWEDWDCWWACTTSTPGLIIWGAWFFCLLLLFVPLGRVFRK